MVIATVRHRVQGKQLGVTVEGGQGVQGPATGAHADYTKNGGPRRLLQLAQAPRTNDVRLRSLSEQELADAQNGHWAIVNVWRNIRDEPLEHTPLARSSLHAAVLRIVLHASNTTSNRLAAGVHSFGRCGRCRCGGQAVGQSTSVAVLFPAWSLLPSSQSLLLSSIAPLAFPRSSLPHATGLVQAERTWGPWAIGGVQAVIDNATVEDRDRV